MCKLSVIIPLYNGELYIEKCVKSLPEQDLSKTDYEIIIVNDGSIDGSLKKVLELQKQYANIRLINQENTGVGAARGRGLKEANGEYIHFVDADDYVESNIYKSLLSYAYDCNLDLLFFRYKLINGTSESMVDNFNSTIEHRIMSGKEAMAMYRFHHSVCLSLIRKEFIKNSHTSFSKNVWGEDILFITSLLLNSKAVARINKICYNYVKYNENSATRKKNSLHLRKMADSYFNVSIELNNMINEHINDEVSDTIWVEVIRNNINIFVYFGIIKYILSKIEDAELLVSINRLKNVGIYPIGKISSGINLRDRILYRFINNMSLMRFVCKLSKIIL